MEPTTTTNDVAQQQCDRGDCKHQACRLRAAAAGIDRIASDLFDMKDMDHLADDRIKLFAVAHRLNKIADNIQPKIK